MGQPVVHFEVQGSDREALARFYAELFGWKTNDISEMKYTMVETGDDGGINGGIGATPDGAPGGATFYVGSDNVAASLQRVAELGGVTWPARWTCPTATSGLCSPTPRGTWSGFTGRVRRS
jgi:hypothetical protein